MITNGTNSLGESLNENLVMDQFNPERDSAHYVL